MPTWTVVGPLTGSGVHVFTPFITPKDCWIVVDPSGPMQKLDFTDPARYLGIGWWASLDNLVSDGPVPDGAYLYPVRWITYLKELARMNDEFADSGIDGFRYDLKPGVSVTWYFSAP